jgi:hypothetical protein
MTQNAIWHVLIGGVQQGPLTKSQVFEFLTSGKLSGEDLIWCPGFPDWKAVSDVDEFWQPPRVTSRRKAPPQPPPLTDHNKSDKRISRQKWSLWKSASIGLLVSALTLALQVANGRGFELANYAHTRSAETISGLVGQTLAAPLIFVVIALVGNFRRKSASTANTVAWTATFAALLVGVFGALFIYGEIFFASDEAIAGEARKSFVANFGTSCARRQRSISQAATEGQIQTYCTCVSGKVADATTYRQLGTDADARALADLKQRVEAAGTSCR